MSQFINYKTRSVALPPGCKDLIDVLRPTGPPKAEVIISPDERPAVTRGGLITGRLSEIGKYVAMVFHARGEMVILLMSTPDEQVTMHLGRDRSRTIAASVVFGYGGDREKAIRAFYQRHGLETPPDSGKPEHFSPHLPVHCNYPVTPLPSEPAPIAEMATELFRSVCALDDKAEIRFRYYECVQGPQK